MSLTYPQRPLNWSIISNITAQHIGALFAPFTFSPTALVLTLFLHWFVGGLGITLGYHRLLTHRSFKTHKWLEYIFATIGCLAVEGGPIEWVGIHRLHHKHSDTLEDPHNANQGFWWSHMRWLTVSPPPDAYEQIRKVTGDLNGDPYYEFLSKYFLVPHILCAIILYLFGGWSFVVWGLFVRVVLVYHTTWLVNSASHKFGYRTFECDDCSRNCWWVGILAYGEGWHNNHHAYPYSARHGLQWWEIDATWMAIRVLNFLGLAWNIRLPKTQETDLNEQVAT
jgi:sn-1 stearoyl-lipid 9-desaturase